MTRTSIVLLCGAVLMLAGSISSQAQKPPADPVRRTSRPVRGQYLVRLNDNTDADAVALQTVGAFRGRLRHVFRHALQGFAVQLTDAAARTLARDPRVLLVEEDSFVSPAAVQMDPPSWGLDRIDQRMRPLDGKYSYPTPATATNVYVIDSGIRVTHVEFEARAFIAGDFVDDDGDGDAADIGNDDDDPYTPDGHDCVGHGTHMGATIGGLTTGIAKNALIWGLRVIGCNGFGTWSAVIAAIDMVTAEARRPAIVNVSLSGSPNAVADAAIERSIASGLTYVVAAGNEGDDAGNYSPSRVPSAVVVASTGFSDGRSFFSNWGPAVDLFAPGEDIVSAGIESDTHLVSASGTSAAAAHVTGVAALYLASHPSASALVVRSAIANAATPGLVADANGSPNRLLYSGFVLRSPALTVTYPNRHVNWGTGSRQPITWTHELPVNSSVRVLLSRDDGRTFVPIAERVLVSSPAAGGITWLVTGPNTTAARIRVEAADGSASDESDAAFVIGDPFIRLMSPNGGDLWLGNTRAAVRWRHNLGPLDVVSITLSKNGGITYHWPLVPRTVADGVELLTIEPSWSTRHARLRIAWQQHSDVVDVSDGTFVIRPR
jgi:Subtilase family/Peptidase inhibitor I9